MFLLKDAWVRLQKESVFDDVEPIVEAKGGQKRTQHATELVHLENYDNHSHTCKWKAKAQQQAQVMQEIEGEIAAAFAEVKARQAEADAREERLLESLEKVEREKRRLEVELSVVKDNQGLLPAGNSQVQDLLVSRVDKLLVELHEASQENERLQKEVRSLQQRVNRGPETKGAATANSSRGVDAVFQGEGVSAECLELRRQVSQLQRELAQARSSSFVSIPSNGVPLVASAWDPPIPPPWSLHPVPPPLEPMSKAERALQPLRSNGPWGGAPEVRAGIGWAGTKAMQKVLDRKLSANKQAPVVLQEQTAWKAIPNLL